MIKFIYQEPQTNSLTFEDVERDQFFVFNGSLYQKINSTTANQIADSFNSPYAVNGVIFEQQKEIDRLLPIVQKIEF